MEPLRELGEKRLGRLFWQYALPSVAGTLTLALYYIIDSLFLAHGPGLGDHALGALGVLLPVMSFLSALGMLAGVGTASRISIYLGGGDRATAERLMGTSLVFTFLVSAVPIAAMYIWMSPLLEALGATEHTLGFARDFLNFYLPAALFLNMGTTLTSILKAVGYPARALQVMVLGVVLNLVLAPLFIFVFRWGMKGAGGAALLATLISAGGIIPHFLGSGSPLPIRGALLRLDGRLLLRIVDIGFAPFLITAATSVIVFFTNRGLVAWGGVYPQEGYVIASRFHYLFTMIFVGISQGIQPIVGYNFGAGNYRRLFGTPGYAFRVVAVVGLCALAAGVFATGPLVGIFRPGPELAGQAEKALWMLTVTMPLAGCQIVMSGFFQHIGLALRSALLSVARLAVFIPLVLLLPEWRGVDGVWFSLPLSEAVVFVATAIVYHLQRRRMIAS